MVHLDVVVVVPWLAVPMPDLHEPYAALDEPAGDKNLPGLQTVAITVAHVLRLARDIESVRRLALHTIGELERLDPRLQCGITLPGLAMGGVELLNQIELPALFL